MVGEEADTTELGLVVTDGGGAIWNVEGDIGSKALPGEAGSDISEAETETGDLKSGGDTGGELMDALALPVSLATSWPASVELVTLVPLVLEEDVTS